MMKGGGQQGQKEKKAKEKVVTFKPKLEECTYTGVGPIAGILYVNRKVHLHVHVPYSLE